MAKHTLILHGRVPSKKNSKRRVTTRRGVFMIPSKNHEDWHAIQMHALRVWPHGMISPKKISLEFTAPDRRKADLSNKAESVMDLLVDAGIIKDDSWFVIPELNLKLVDTCKEMARVVIHFE